MFLIVPSQHNKLLAMAMSELQCKKMSSVNTLTFALWLEDEKKNKVSKYFQSSSLVLQAA